MTNAIANAFNPKRFFLLTKKDIIQGYKPLLISVAAIIGVCLFILMVSTPGEAPMETHQGIFLPLLWLGGLIFTSMVFKEAHSDRLIHHWLMVPASQLEKFLQKLLLSTVIFVIAILAAFFMATVFNALVYLLFFERRPPLFNPFQSWVWFNIGHYMIVQSLFFLGAIWFKKYNFVKTVLSLNVLQLILASIMGGIAYMVYLGPIRESIAGNQNYFMEAGYILSSRFSSVNPVFIRLAKVIYFGLLAPFFWFVSWLRMREVEVKDGV